MITKNYHEYMEGLRVRPRDAQIKALTFLGPQVLLHTSALTAQSALEVDLASLANPIWSLAHAYEGLVGFVSAAVASAAHSERGGQYGCIQTRGLADFGGWMVELGADLTYLREPGSLAELGPFLKELGSHLLVMAPPCAPGVIVPSVLEQKQCLGRAHDIIDELSWQSKTAAMVPGYKDCEKLRQCAQIQ